MFNDLINENTTETLKERFSQLAGMPVEVKIEGSVTDDLKEVYSIEDMVNGTNKNEAKKDKKECKCGCNNAKDCKCKKPVNEDNLNDAEKKQIKVDKKDKITGILGNEKDTETTCKTCGGKSPCACKSGQ